MRGKKKKETEKKKCVRAAVPSSSSYPLSAFQYLLLALLSHAATNNNDDVSSSASLVSVLSFYLRDLVHSGTLHLQTLLFSFLPSFLLFSIALQFWFHLNLFFCFFLPPPCFLQNNSSISVTHWNSDVLEIGKRLCEDAEEKGEEEGKDRQTDR